MFCQPSPHRHHAFQNYYGTEQEGLVVASRRSMLKASFAGVAGLSLSELLRTEATAAGAGQASSRPKSVILVWMAGGPSHIDTWDVKPHRPYQNRGPFSAIQTSEIY